ncbi:MAG: hypothetical protein E4G96_05125 [Chrysiogenales bacterium]|nr:MAG: hypothetical protein E4G96_05125 [Chrysiogenales bacterium]
MKNRVCIIMVLCAAAVFAQCGKNIRRMETGRADAGKKILIAAFYSDYKDTIVQGLVERFRDTAKITVVPLSDLGGVHHGDFDALVVIDSLRAWKMFNTRTRHFIRKIDDPEGRKKIVLFLSAGNPKKNYSILGVDSITAASEADQDTAIIEKISERVREILR